MAKFGIINLLLAAAGGALGSLARYVVSGLVDDWYGRGDFPFGTLAVNVVGCLVIGVLTHLAEAHKLLSTEARVFLVVGILGGFTTFSSFGNDTVNLWRTGQMGRALLNVGAQLVLGLGAVWLGHVLARKVWG
jgi:CrcB protein